MNGSGATDAAERPLTRSRVRQRPQHRPRHRPRHRATFFGVVGEILVTVGVVTLLYVGWQLWFGDVIYGAERNATGRELSEQWLDDALALPAPTAPADATAPPAAPVVAEPVVLPEPADAEIFGVMRIPRFGADYNVPMAGGVTRSGTLDAIGIGHYPGTPMPGAMGNVALAAHRTTFGAPFNRLADLHVGDAIVIQTPAGWYTYRFRTLQYVQPDAVDVLLPVPQVPDARADGRYLTMTSCSPMFSLAERIVAYSVFESFTPIADGEPASLREAIV